MKRNISSDANFRAYMLEKLREEALSIENAKNMIDKYSHLEDANITKNERFLVMKMYIDSLKKHYDKYYELSDKIDGKLVDDYRLCQRELDILDDLYKTALKTKSRDLINYVDNMYLNDKELLDDLDRINVKSL